MRGGLLRNITDFGQNNGVICGKIIINAEFNITLQSDPIDKYRSIK